MISTTSNDSRAHVEEDEPARINALFYEADRLEESAYRLFNDSRRDAQTWQRFNEAKAMADAKRTEAYQAWMQLRRQPRR
ncbi:MULTISPECIES: hypothetical protein [unclassified Pseudomonas]|uniref:hypothetical protein n=1 Tax=unclassified Pseudomonas TaxID=196821 RepID=UPI00164969C8|nr:MULTISPECIES: hypothetical protein [unclassified Pseudomonas]MBC3207480.1 hypothetical protein [Pseudomonas sp. SWRI111]MBC3271241.1 hypothetical protein [Pseudomonas sp. SWRI81]MBC3777108.1 hypothetical protein [Pseudomonas sp. SWRI99]